MRDPTNYNYQCSLLDGPLASADSVTYGVLYRSPLNELKHFHVANGQLPHDIMHVILEGALPLEVRLLLRKCIDDNLFTLDNLNDRISNFAYGRLEARNKPPKPFSTTHLTTGRLPLSG